MYLLRRLFWLYGQMNGGGGGQKQIPAKTAMKSTRWDGDCSMMGKNKYRAMVLTMVGSVGMRKFTSPLPGMRTSPEHPSQGLAGVMRGRG